MIVHIFVLSNRNCLKLVNNGYLATKDENIDDLYYRCCKKRTTVHCGGYSCAILINGLNNLRITKEQNNSPDDTTS